MLRQGKNLYVHGLRKLGITTTNGRTGSHRCWTERASAVHHLRRRHPHVVAGRSEYFASLKVQHTSTTTAF